MKKPTNHLIELTQEQIDFLLETLKETREGHQLHEEKNIMNNELWSILTRAK